MGKKKAAPSACELLKDQGNKAFSLNQFEVAIDLYTQAITASGAKPSHIYLANRANSYL